MRLPASPSHFFTPRFPPTGSLSWQRDVRNGGLVPKPSPNYRTSRHRPCPRTAVLGLILTIFGVALSSRIGTWFPRIAGALLIGLGLFYIWRQLSGHAHSHTHLFSKGGHQHEHELKESLAHFRAPDISRTRTSDWVAISNLFAMLTFSRCEAFLPIYVSGIRFG